MSRDIHEMERGDYVQKMDGSLHKVHDVWGISKYGRLAKPSLGGFWIETDEGNKIGMFEARAYFKKEDLDETGRALRRH